MYNNSVNKSAMLNISLDISIQYIEGLSYSLLSIIKNGYLYHPHR